MNQQKNMLDILSASSLFIEILYNHAAIGTSTGFVIEKDAEYYFVTNWHVISGKRPSNDKSILKDGAIPDKFNIIHHSKTLGTWKAYLENLYDKNKEYCQKKGLVISRQLKIMMKEQMRDDENGR